MSDWEKISIIILIVSIAGLLVYITHIQSENQVLQIELKNYDADHVSQSTYESVLSERNRMSDKITEYESKVQSDPHIEDPKITLVDLHGDEVIKVLVHNYKAFYGAEKESITVKPSCSFNLETVNKNETIEIEFDEVKLEPYEAEHLSVRKNIVKSGTRFQYWNSSCEDVSS